MYDVLSGYFSSKSLKISFTFQSKYLGMSPWSCPAAFMIIPYIEHAFGIYHVTGGLSRISESMAKVVKEEKGKIHLNKTVKELILDGKRVKGIKLSDGQKIFADKVIINSDFAYSMTNIVGKRILKRWNKEKLMKKNFSCSTFMIYLGLDKVYDLPHHNIIFSENYEKYIKDISKHKDPSDDISLYIRNASINDKTIAPKGMSNIYVLVPVSNRKSRFDWTKNKIKFRDLVIKKIKEKTSIKDIEKHIVFEKIITPDDWEEEYNVFLGATFNLGHDLFQMLYFRPHNKFEELQDCYLVGGGTHPGSGLPTIYESGRITANMISSHYKIPFKFLNKHIK
jgi:phytoene desaturase